MSQGEENGGVARREGIELVRAHLSPEELAELRRLRPLRAWASIATNWGIVFASFAAVAAWPNPLVIVAALFAIGGRQLGMAVLMHEAAHKTLFATPRWNDFAGNWLQAYPIWADLYPYRRYHAIHHAHTGTGLDPDLGLVRPFPISRASLRRKIVRDLTGQTGWKQAKAVFLRDMGWRGGTQRDRGNARVGWRVLLPVAVTNALLLGVLWSAGYPALYLLWVGAWLTTYRLATRIRSIAEHALTGPPSDPLRNTRTTRANPLERLLIAPNRVNFHLEHHLVTAVPHYRLPRLHRLLSDRGLLDDACVAPGYAAVLRGATGAPVG